MTPEKGVNQKPTYLPSENYELAIRRIAVEKDMNPCPKCKSRTWIYEEDSYYTCLLCDRNRLTALNEKYRKALEKIAKPALGGKQQQWIAQQALKAETGGEK